MKVHAHKNENCTRNENAQSVFVNGMQNNVPKNRPPIHFERFFLSAWCWPFYGVRINMLYNYQLCCENMA